MIHFSGNITSKLPSVGTTIFSQMSALANEHNAVNLSQGFPDFSIDPLLIELVNKHMLAGSNQYAPMPGQAKLREVLCDKLERSYGIKYDYNTEITVTSGATQAIYTAISAFIRDEDEVIIFTPAYDCYAPAINLNGGKAIYCPLEGPNYDYDWDMVKKMVTNRTKMIIINSPHNPTGSIASKQDMQTLEEIIKDRDIIVLSDEVYEHIIFDKEEHQSICNYPHLATQSMAVFSFGKTFHLTGWKLGYIVGPEQLMKEFRKVHQFNVFSANHPLQAAIADYIESGNVYNELGTFYQEKRDYFTSAVEASNFDILPCKGTYFQLLSYKNISDKTDVDYAIELTKTKGIASIPVSVFYNSKKDDQVLRFCFAKKEETLKRACDILTTI
jgi:methionine aminotransferase